MRHNRIMAGALALAALPFLGGCTRNVASLSCEEMGDHAKEASQSQQIKITAISNTHETSRNEMEARCTGDATLSDGSNTQVYLRAYKDGDNSIVAYQGTPFN